MSEAKCRTIEKFRHWSLRTPARLQSAVHYMVAAESLSPSCTMRHVTCAKERERSPVATELLPATVGDNQMVSRNPSRHSGQPKVPGFSKESPLRYQYAFSTGEGDCKSNRTGNSISSRRNSLQGRLPTESTGGDQQCPK